LHQSLEIDLVEAFKVCKLLRIEEVLIIYKVGDDVVNVANQIP
jgi:hypothetical protein